MRPADYRNAILKDWKLKPNKSYHAVTLTFGKKRYEQQYSREACEKTLRHFLNVLNKRLFKNGYKSPTKFKRRLEVLAVMEGDDVYHRHYHLLLERPEDLSDFRFFWITKECWAKTHLGGSQIKIHYDADKGWLNYMLKARSKEKYDDSIDWVNCYRDV